jgi:competence protein ComEC
LVPQWFSTKACVAAAVLLTGSCVLAWHEWQLQPDGRLHVHVFDVGQGDSFLLVSPSGKQIFVDGGPNLSVLEHLGTFMPFFDRTLELLVLTHPDADHLTAFPELFERYTVERILLTGVAHRSGRYDALLSFIAQKHPEVLIQEIPLVIDVGDGLTLETVWPQESVLGQESDHVNDTSIVFRARKGEWSMLLTGDIEEPTETALLASGTDLHADVLKAPHHGSRTSSSTRFLLAVDPSLILISVAEDSPFGHPHPEIIDRYKVLGIPVRSTAQEGTISLTVP